jgi:hypothetical protein
MRAIGVFLSLSLAAALATSALIPARVHACSCAVPGPPAQSLAGGSAVFEGVAVGPSVPTPARISPELDGRIVQQVFEVKRRWKGAKAARSWGAP